MKNVKRTIVSLFMCVGLLGLSLFLSGCPDEEKGLVEGGVYLVTLQVLTDRTLYAASIDGMGEKDRDDHKDKDWDDEDKDWEEDDEEECDDEDDEEEEWDKEDDRGDWGRAIGFNTQINAIDIERRSFTVFSGLTVLMKDWDEGNEEDYEDDEGDCEDEEEDCDDEEEDADEIVSKSSRIDDREDGDDEEEDCDDEDDWDDDDCDEDDWDEDDWDEDEFDFERLLVGMWVKVSGYYDDEDRGVFYVEKIGLSDTDRHMILAEITDLGGSHFSMLGLRITYDSKTTIAGKDRDKDRPR